MRHLSMFIITQITLLKISMMKTRQVTQMRKHLHSSLLHVFRLAMPQRNTWLLGYGNNMVTHTGYMERIQDITFRRLGNNSRSFTDLPFPIIKGGVKSIFI